MHTNDCKCIFMICNIYCILSVYWFKRQHVHVSRCNIQETSLWSSHPAEEMAILSVYQSKPKLSKKGRKDFCQETTYGLPRVEKKEPMPCQCPILDMHKIQVQWSILSSEEVSSWGLGVTSNHPTSHSNKRYSPRRLPDQQKAYLTRLLQSLHGAKGPSIAQERKHDQSKLYIWHQIIIHTICI